MAASLKLKDYVPDVKSATSSVAERISAIEELGRDVRGEGAIHDLEREVANLRRGAERLVAESRQRRPGNLDALIEKLLTDERQADEDSRALIKSTKRALRLVKKAPPAYRKAVEPLMTRTIDLLQEQKEIRRDARWQLMLIKADAVPEGRGLVFDDPKALKRHLTRRRA
jgi:hypothetical protein